MRSFPAIFALFVLAAWQCVPAGEVPVPDRDPVMITPLVQPKIDPAPYRQFFEPGAYLMEGSTIHGVIPDSIILRRAQRLARVDVTIVCGKVTVLAIADRSSNEGFLSLTLKRLVIETPSGKKEVAVSGFAMGTEASMPGVPCHVTDDLLVTDQKASVMLILTGALQVPE